jgi:hypothetical protein
MTLKFLARLIDALSIWQAASVVTLCSSALVWPVRRLRFLNLVAAIAMPAALAYSLYWLPVWLVPPDLNNASDLHKLDRYGAWAALEEALLFIPASLASLAVVTVSSFRASRRKATDCSPGTDGRPCADQVQGRP